MSVQLYCGDCLEILSTLGAGSVDAIVTDPPYGIGFDYSGNSDVSNTPGKYAEWFLPLFTSMQEKVRPGGFIAIWQPQPYFKYFWEWYGDNIHIYCAAKNFVQLRKTPINYAYDPVVMFYTDGDEKLRPTKPRRNLDFFVANTAAIVSDPTRIERGHPCPRPLDAVTEIIDNFVIPGGLVLDLFMGSGTTGVACVKTSRSFIGIEINSDYFEIAQKRIAEAQQQPRLEGLT